ncbi:hypothetical protein ACVRWT_02390 [Streptococcus porcinus]
MKKTQAILAVFSDTNIFQQEFFKTLSNYYSELFEITVAPSSSNFDFKEYNGIFSFVELETQQPIFYFSEQLVSKAFFITEERLKDGQIILELSSALNQFYQSISHSLWDLFPYQIRLSDNSGNFTYHNHQFNGSFFEDEEKRLETWLYHQFKSSRVNQTKHFLLPTASLDHIYFQSYYSLTNNEGHYLGTIDIVQDLKPILAQYLEETAQAIVGWSDVTSGPSISDNL